MKTQGTHTQRLAWTFLVESAGPMGPCQRSSKERIWSTGALEESTESIRIHRNLGCFDSSGMLRAFVNSS